MEPVSCPYCNAPLQIRQFAGKAVCSRCGEPAPPHLVEAARQTRLSLHEKTTFRGSKGDTGAPTWTNRKIALGVLGVMLLMAGVGLVYALYTVSWRRQNDFRGGKGIATPLIVPSDSETALGYLPDNSNVVASVHIADLLKDSAGQKLLAAPRPPLLDVLFGTIENWTRLSPESLNSVALGTEVRGKFPQLTIAIETRRPYDADTLAKAAKLGPPTQQRGKPLYRFALKPGEGMLWCPGPTTLILLLRLDALKLEDLDALPTAPRQGSDALPRAVQQLMAERGDRQSLLWLAGNLDDQSLVKEILSFTLIPADQATMIGSLKAFSVRLRSREDLVLLGDFRLGDPKASQTLEKQLAEIKSPNLDSVKVAADPANEWITLQIHAKAEAMRELLSGWGSGNGKSVK